MCKKQVAVVTGASRGIGRAIAIQLATQGCFVIVNYNGSKEAALNTKEEIVSRGGEAEVYQCDVADYSESERFFSEIIKTYGTIDVLVNNAGINRDGLIIKMSEEDFDRVIDTNMKGAFHCIRFALKAMLRQKSGRIINISSVSGVMGNAGQANYAASKAGIIGLTKSVAREVASRHITVNAVAPGFIQTDMTEKLSDAVKERVKAGIPLGQFGKPEDVAAMVGFLATKEADYITGQVICVDGGMAM
ncbi:MAG: 3-oxoacyl-[acyl-carrier-protein] reductase [bacterium]|nr:3-oxoacyl-[acyl-carrier-protein] reductase [bacterium]